MSYNILYIYQCKLSQDVLCQQILMAKGNLDVRHDESTLGILYLLACASFTFWNQTKNQDTWFDKYLCTYEDIRGKYLFLNSITALLEPWKYTCASPILIHHTHLHVHSHTVLCSTLSAHLYEIILSTQEKRTTQRSWYVFSTSYFASLASHCQQGGAIDVFGATCFFSPFISQVNLHGQMKRHFSI